MARAATAPELALFRTAGQWSRPRCAIYTPTTIYSARINQSFSTLDKVLEITYDTGSGTLADVLSDMTLYVGSTAGAWDKGIARVRAIDSTKVYIGETSDIRFANNDYLTIVDSFELWARPVLISSAVAYMDGGVAYSDQHTNYLPLIRGGPTGRVIEKTGATVSATFSFPATIPGASVASRSTSAPGSSGISGGTTSAPTVTWNSVGWKKVYHTVTSTNGKSAFIVRYVFVWDSTNLPEPVEITENPRGEVEAGGWSAGITLYDAASLSQVRDHALVILFTEDHYGATEDEIGPVSGCENIVFLGWIAKESIEWRSEGGSVTFTAYGPHYWLQKIPSWPDGVKFTTAAPETWTRIKNLTIDLGLVHHFLQWRTTAPRIMDIFPSGDTKYTKKVVSLASDIWSQIREMAFDQIFARALCNRYGQLYIEVNPQLIPQASRSHPTVMTFQERDLEEPVSLDRVTEDDTSIIDLSGVEINSAGHVKAYFSLSPGHAHSHYGSSTVIPHLLLSSQAQANQLAGLYRGWMNNPFPSVPLKLAANNRLIDICPLQKCALTIAAGDTIRGVSESLGLIPLSIEEVFDPESGYARQEITFEGETFEDLSITGDTPGSGNVSYPPLPPLSKLPPIDIIIPGTGTGPQIEGDPSRVIVFDQEAGLLYTENFDDAAPHWEQINAGLGGIAWGTTEIYKTIHRFFVTPSGAIYAGRYVRLSGATWNVGGDYFFLARAPSIGATFEILWDWNTFDAEGEPGFFEEWGLLTANYNPLVPEEVAVVMRKEQGGLVNKIYIGAVDAASFTAGTAVAEIGGGGQVSIGLSYGLGNWLYGVSNAWQRLSPDVSSILAAGTGTNVLPSNPESESIVRADATGRTYMFPNGAGNLVIGDDNMASSSLITLTDLQMIGMDSDATGQYLMTRYGSGLGAKGKSSDFGSSWAGLPSLPPGNWYFANAGNGQKWVAAGGSSIRYSPDFGDTWYNKEGNLLYVSPLPNIKAIKVIG